LARLAVSSAAVAGKLALQSLMETVGPARRNAIISTFKLFEIFPDEEAARRDDGVEGSWKSVINHREEFKYISPF
jgi:hypothetical protein